ncbi:MAG: phosphoribosyl-ATP diphosphatase [Pseudomonadales bacterium]
MDIIADLTRVLRARRDADPETSYVASLYQKGTDKILEKVGEEATEALLAAKNLQFALDQQEAAERPQQALIGEVADLWFHTMVMMVKLDVDPAAVLQTLQDRHGVSGHTEKANRTE